MLNQKIDMSVDYAGMGFEKPEKQATLTTYILDNIENEGTGWLKRPAVIVCPGGGYGNVSPREAEPIALRYTAVGFHAFVLDYSVAPLGWPAPCCELAKAIAYVRSIAEEYHIDTEKIIVCGFSAGGHLAASSGVHYDNEEVKKFAGVDGISNKPNGMILCYPVITDDEEKMHKGTFDHFVAEREDVKKLFGLEHYVTEDTPKAFIWHTYTDTAVPVENSMKFASACMEKGVNCELHIFPRGGHGLSLANKQVCMPEFIYPEIQPWVDMSIAWLENSF